MAEIWVLNAKFDLDYILVVQLTLEQHGATGADPYAVENQHIT